MSEDETGAIEYVSNRIRRVLGVLGFIVIVVVIGGLLVANQFGPVQAVGYVVLVSVLAGALFPRFV